MAVNLSPVFGVAGQLFDNNGNPLAGGKIFTYAAGTTTPATTYTNASGSVAHSNPIVLDGAGRVPSGEIWLTDGVNYKFVVQDSANNLIGTYDNLTGINSNFVAFTNEQEIQTATAGQTVFTLTTMQYQPGTNSLSVFVDGVNQYGPGAQYAYVETSSTVVTFVTGLHVGASVKFTTSQLNSSGAVDASQVSYDPPFVGSVATNVEDKLAQTVSVKDFGAVGDGVTDDTAAIQAATNTGKNVFFPDGLYTISGVINATNNGQSFFGSGVASKIQADTSVNGFSWFDTGASITSNVEFRNLWFIGNGAVRTSASKTGNDYVLSIQNTESVRITNCKFEDCFSTTGAGKAVWVWKGSSNVIIAGNFFANNGGQDVNFYGSDGSVYRCTAANNIHFNTQGECYEVEGRNATTIAAYEVYDVTIANNQIRSDIVAIASAGAEGLLCIGGRGVKFIGNTVNRRGQNGVKLIGSQNVLIENNQFFDLSNTGKNGVRVTTDVFGVNGSSYAVTITGNTFNNGITDAAVWINVGESSSTSSRVIITENNIANSGTGISVGYVEDVTISNNAIDFSTVPTPLSVNTGFQSNKSKIDNIDTSGYLFFPYVAKPTNYDTSVSGALSFDVSTGTTTFMYLLSGNITSIAHVGTPKLGMEVSLVFNQGGAPSNYTLPLAANWTNFQLASLTAPVMTAIAGRKTTLRAVWTGTFWLELARTENVGV